MSNEETKYKALDKVIQKVISGEADHKPRYWESWEELKRVELAMGYRHKFTTEQMEDVAEQAINEVWKNKNAYASAVVKARNIDAAEVIMDLCNQFGYQDHDKAVKKYDYYSGGLSALEGAFTWLIINGYAKGDHLTVKLIDKK